MKLSVVIPAFNEADYLPETLAALRAALTAHADHPALDACELIVCDNNSTDATAAVARAHGARVVSEPHNQISRARNTGAATADGDWLLFVDADTHVPPEMLGDLLDHIATGRYVGGGGGVRFDGGGWLMRLVARTTVALFRWMRWAGGAFLWCRADAFRQVGGFSEDVYAGEEVFLSRALKAWGRSRGLRCVFLARAPVVTSARKMRTHGLGAILWIAVRGMFRPRSTLGSREHLGYFYDGRR